MPEILMGKKSGVDNVGIWSAKLGVKLTEDETMAVLRKVKLTSHDLKRVLTLDEFKKIVDEVRAGK
jgi:isopropylmalate/homocitrate/citramalate synthase